MGVNCCPGKEVKELLSAAGQSKRLPVIWPLTPREEGLGLLVSLVHPDKLLAGGIKYPGLVIIISVGSVSSSLIVFNAAIGNSAVSFLNSRLRRNDAAFNGCHFCTGRNPIFMGYIGTFS